MEIKTIILLLAAIVFTGCVTDGSPTTASETRRALVNGGCSEGNLKFHIGDSYMKVTPENKCMKVGLTYTADIVAHGGYTVVAGDVNISGAALWLNKSNTPNKDEILIVVPAGTVPAEYKYSLEASDAGTLDPHVKVVR